MQKSSCGNCFYVPTNVNILTLQKKVQPSLHHFTKLALWPDGGLSLVKTFAHTKKAPKWLLSGTRFNLNSKHHVSRKSGTAHIVQSLLWSRGVASRCVVQGMRDWSKERKAEHSKILKSQISHSGIHILLN